MELRDISESLGITLKNVKRRLNTYYALEIFRNDAEYGDYFAPNKLSSIFYENLECGNSPIPFHYKILFLRIIKRSNNNVINL